MVICIKNRVSVSSQLLGKGFALIATIAVMSLLVMIALAMLSLATIEVRQSNHTQHQEIAKANARMALMLALGELQKTMGPDQRVSARADILENPASSIPIPNRNWLGTWKTTYTVGTREWPLIGQNPTSGTAPYLYKNIYSDLRESESSLQTKQWREQLHQGWLVSRRTGNIAYADYKTKDLSAGLNVPVPNVLEIIGRGTLGDDLSALDYANQRVLVEKVDLTSDGTVMGAYAWYISDENQKASISLDPNTASLAHGDSAKHLNFLASQTDNPEVVAGSATNPFKDYNKNADGKWAKIASYGNAALTADAGAENLATALGENFHHLTANGSGLFTNTVLGGLRRDLTPLLFGDKDNEKITFASPDSSVADHPFLSDSPIIPGPRKAVLGPSFGALRYWGRMKYNYSSTGEFQAQITHETPAQTLFQRHWAGWNIDWGDVNAVRSDGMTFRGDTWASSAPKVHPVMVDARWHFYCSYFGSGASQNLRSHIIPRVLMWNPYNVTMRSDQLLVLMSNPIPNWGAASDMGFSIDDSLSNQEKEKWGTTWPEHAVGTKGMKIPFRRINGQEGLLPNPIYLGFVLEPTTFKPGECLVFSPSVGQGSGDSISAGDVTIKRYDRHNISNNVLSSAAEQDKDHFYHDYEQGFVSRPTFNSHYGLPVASDGEQVKVEDVEFSDIDNYGFWAPYGNNRPFMLKSTPTSNWSRNIAEIVGGAGSSGLSSFPTLQLICNGAAGPATGGISDIESKVMGSARAASPEFGTFGRFTDDPTKDAPRNHQFGSKLVTLDESLTEASDFHRQFPEMAIRTQWDSEHIAYHPASVANWNVRPGLVTRSPSCATGNNKHATSNGAWLYQYLPLSPGDDDDMGILNDDNNYARSPFLMDSNSSAALFDLPHQQYGTLSMGSLRHAQMSPYSFHPSYIVGNSLINLHAPHETSSHSSQESPQAYQGIGVPSGWDNLLGAGLGTHGISVGVTSASVLLQVGVATPLGEKTVEGTNFNSRDEILAYDIAFEVNQNLWDGYFISGMPMSTGSSKFDWDPTDGTPLWNARYTLNSAADTTIAKAKLAGADSLEFGFWHNSYLLKNKGAFNVNSTSVKAWTAFLSGLMGIDRTTASGSKVGGGTNTVFSRVLTPENSAITEDAKFDQEGGWQGGRTLTSGEIETLAGNIVTEVKARGPFISMADFINRRLAAQQTSSAQEDDPSMMGAIEAAIVSSGLNVDANYATRTDLSFDNTHPDWTIKPEKQPESKAWGMPGHLTQGDILEPLAPSMTVRGDSFVIRTYGESRVGNEIKAKAWLEVIVERSPDYVKPASIDPAVTAQTSENHPATPALKLHLDSGELTAGNLSLENSTYGRKFIIKSFRWLPNF